MYEVNSPIDNSNSASNKMFSFTGRISRTDYWFNILKIFLIAQPFLLVIVPCMNNAPFVGVIVTFLLVALSLTILCASTSKRFHDLGFSAKVPVVLTALVIILRIANIAAAELGTWPVYYITELARMAVEFVTIAVSVVVGGILPGKEGINQYGSNPVRKYYDQLCEYTD